KLANNLLQADPRVFLFQYLSKVYFRRFEKMDQRPSRSARFKKHVIQFQPGSFDHGVAWRRGRWENVRITGEISIQSLLTDTGTKALRQVTESGFHRR